MTKPWWARMGRSRMYYTVNSEYYRTQYPDAGGLVHWHKDNPFFGDSSISSQGTEWTVRNIYIDTERPDWPLSLAHEWGHCLLALIKPLVVQRALDASRSQLALHSPALQLDIQRAEVMAWRLAKTYLRPTLWNETKALEGLSSYWAIFGLIFPFEKFKIIPYQKGEFWPKF